MTTSKEYVAFEGGRITESTAYSEDTGTVVDRKDYEYLRDLALDPVYGHIIKIAVTRDGESLCVGRYAGIIPLTSGNVLEILPKCFSDSCDVGRARYVLCNMLAQSGYLPKDIFQPIPQTVMKRPLHTLIVTHFLIELEKLILYRLSAMYTATVKKRTVLRGKILVQRQLTVREPVPQYFWTQAGEYSENCPENRLIKSSLECIALLAKKHEPMRFARIKSFFDNTPASSDIDQDFRSWSNDRLLAHYQNIKLWCTLILAGTGMSIPGKHAVPSLLYSMERLFEAYVGFCIQKNKQTEYRLVSQSTRWSLFVQGDQKISVLRPDYLLRKNSKDCCIVDAKWKLLESNNETTSSDMMQMYTYGRSYLQGQGKLALVYPKTRLFTCASEPYVYSYDTGLSVVCIPIDLENDPEELKVFLDSI